MKKLATLIFSLVLAFYGFSAAAAPRHGSGKPAQTGLDRAETRANAHGLSGIENAEAKQARTKDDSGKKLAKGKAKAKKHKQANK